MAEHVPRTKIQYVVASEFEAMRNKFDQVSDTAEGVISNAQDKDVLELTISFNSPASVTSARVVTEEDFIKSAF